MNLPDSERKAPAAERKEVIEERVGETTVEGKGTMEERAGGLGGRYADDRDGDERYTMRKDGGRYADDRDGVDRNTIRMDGGRYVDDRDGDERNTMRMDGGRYVDDRDGVDRNTH